MTKEIKDSIIPDESIMSKIYFIRGKKVMLDRDLAELYGVETRNLKRQVRRNELRFPEDFMFELNDKEFENWRCQFGTSNEDRMGLRYKPFAFTEEGVAQLSTVLNSERAIKVNIQIIRMFTKMRSYVLSNKDILRKLEKIERLYDDHDKKIEAIFNYLKKLKSADQALSDFKNRNRIGYKP
ncbi:MAG: ORF6N domain-containing protein [Bacteroidota bacterium]